MSGATGELRKRMIRCRELYLLLALPLLWYAVFHYFPMYGIQIAFRDYYPSKGFLGQPVGRPQALQSVLFLLLLRAGPDQHAVDQLLRPAGGLPDPDRLCPDAQRAQAPAVQEVPAERHVPAQLPVGRRGGEHPAAPAQPEQRRGEHGSPRPGSKGADRLLHQPQDLPAPLRLVGGVGAHGLGRDHLHRGPLGRRPEPLRGRHHRRHIADAAHPLYRDSRPSCRRS